MNNVKTINPAQVWTKIYAEVHDLGFKSVNDLHRAILTEQQTPYDYRVEVINNALLTLGEDPVYAGQLQETIFREYEVPNGIRA